jgi:phosphatidylserine/phosphatidylglycerophosphate/cardiolipin synthase-like enzyme
MVMKKIFLFFLVIIPAVIIMPQLRGISTLDLSLTQHAAHADTISLCPLKKGATSITDKKKISTIDVLLDKAYYASLIKDLSQAHESITIIMYLFKPTDYKSALPDHIIDMLVRKHAQGVDVSMLLNVDQSYNTHGARDGLNDTNLHAAKILEGKGINVYLDSPQRTTHAKVVIIDKKIVYIGSHNLTQRALRYNHEASVRIVSPYIAKELSDYMEALKNEK